MKRKIYIVVFSIIIYFLLQLIYNSFILNNNVEYVYILNKNLCRGDLIKLEDVIKSKVDLNAANNCIKQFKEGYIKYDSYKGQLLLNEMIIEENEYIKIKNNNEIISIKVNQPEDALGYNVNKGDMVNIYFSGKFNDMNNILKFITKENIISSNEGGYVTIRLLENVIIKNIYNRSNTDAIIDTITFEIDKDNALKVNNLKNYGKFSLSLIK